MKKKRGTAKKEAPAAAVVSAEPKTAGAVEGPTADQSDPVTDDDARDHAVTGDAAPVDEATQAAGNLEAGRADGAERGNGAARADGADEADAAEPASTADGPQVATATTPTGVSVPALDERDDVLVAGGPPDNDPGDHRGQPWATTPGEPGLDEGDEVADNTDEGFAAHPPSDAATDTDTDTDTDDHGSQQHGSAADADGAPVDGPETASSAPESSGEPDYDESNRPAGTDDASPADAQAGAERRISGFDEVVDGGYGIGSARPIDDGAQPLAHPVKAWTDRKSFVAPGDKGYDGAEPDVWFYNEDAARRAGFNRD